MLLLIVIKIFFARIFDVSLGTYKTLLTVKGKTILPTVLAFFEVLIWFFVAKEAILIDVDNIIIPISYALGYATGSFIGSYLSKRFIKCVLEVKIYNYNKKVVNYIIKSDLNSYHINDNLIVIYMKKTKDDYHIDNIHKLSKKCIIYTKEVNLSL